MYFEDIYALGLVFHAMWNKEIPILLTDLERTRIHDIFVPDLIPKQFQEFFIRATSEGSENRFQDISQMLEVFRSSYTQYLRDERTTIIEHGESNITNITSLNIDVDAVLKHIEPKYKKLIGHLLKGLNELWKVY